MTQHLRWKEIAHVFEDDDGSLRDIYVSGMSPSTWADFLAGLREWGYALRYTEDGTDAPLPDTVEAVFRRRQEISPLMAIHFAGIQINCHFFIDDELELDLDPREFHGQEQLDALVLFMERIAQRVKGPIRLTPENDHEAFPYLVFDPGAGAWETPHRR
jgi:hypothetical protein